MLNAMNVVTLMLINRNGPSDERVGFDHDLMGEADLDMILILILILDTDLDVELRIESCELALMLT